jgi:hypothetical protein
MSDERFVSLREAAEDAYAAWIEGEGPTRYDPEELKTAMAVLRDVLDGVPVERDPCSDSPEAK